MSAIFLPRRWRHQPQGAVEVDRGNPLARGLVVAYLPTIEGNLLGGRFVRSGQRELVTIPSAYGGIANKFKSSNSRAIDLGPLVDGEPVSWAIAAYTNSSDVNSFLFSTRSTSTALGVEVLFGNGGTAGEHGARSNAINYSTIAPYGSNLHNATHLYGGSSDVNGAAWASPLLAYLDGAEAGSFSFGTSPTAGHSQNLFLGRRGSTYAVQAGVSLALFWNRALSRDEHRAVAENPWQLFRAPSHRIWFDVGAGSSGTTYNESLTESATLGDSLDPLASFFASYAESVTAGDSADNAQTHAAALSESVTPADSATTAQGHAETLAESVTAADSAAPAQTMPVAFSESVTAGDALADEVVPAGSFNESRTESTLVDDAYAHAQTHVAAFLEQVAPGDDYAVTGGTEIVTKRRGAGGSPRGYVARIGGRLVYADTLQALQAAIAQFEASIPARAEKKAQKAGKVVVRRLPKVEVVEAPAEDQGATRAAAQAANERIAAEYIAALQAQIAIRAAMEAAERDDMEAITVLELL